MFAILPFANNFVRFYFCAYSNELLSLTLKREEMFPTTITLYPSEDTLILEIATGSILLDPTCKAIVFRTC